MSEIAKKRTYTIEVTDYTDGTCNMKRTNEGFQAFELIGLVDELKFDLFAQARGEIKPDHIERVVVTTNHVNTTYEYQIPGDVK